MPKFRFLLGLGMAWACLPFLAGALIVTAKWGFPPPFVLAVGMGSLLFLLRGCWISFMELNGLFLLPIAKRAYLLLLYFVVAIIGLTAAGAILFMASPLLSAPLG